MAVVEFVNVVQRQMNRRLEKHKERPVMHIRHLIVDSEKVNALEHFSRLPGNSTYHGFQEQLQEINSKWYCIPGSAR